MGICVRNYEVDHGEARLFVAFNGTLDIKKVESVLMPSLSKELIEKKLANVPYLNLIIQKEDFELLQGPESESLD